MKYQFLQGLARISGTLCGALLLGSSAAAQTPFVENFDGVVAPALPPGWTASNGIAGNGIAWSVSAAGTPVPPSLPNAAVVDAQAGVSDKLLDSPLVTVTAMPASLSFARYIDTQLGFDGMRLEVSINGGSFRYVPFGDFSVGAYDRVIELNSGSPIAGPPAWTGNSGGYVATTYDLPPTVVPGNTVRFRWRMATDATVGGGGVRIDNLVGNNLSVSAAPPAPTAELAVMLTPSANPVVAGTQLTYLATATNNGPSAVPSLSLSTQISGTLISITPSPGGRCNGLNCFWDSATAAGATRSMSFVVRVPANLAAGTDFYATALAVSGVFDPYLDNNMVRLFTPVVGSADVSIALAASPDPVTAGATLTYIASVSNAGPSDATGVVVTIVLPNVAPLVTATVSGGGSCRGVPLVCVLTGNMAPGATRSITMTAAVEPTLPTDRSIQASASLNASSADPNLANNAAVSSTMVNSADVLGLLLRGPGAAATAQTPATVTAVSSIVGALDVQNLQIAIATGPNFSFLSLLTSGQANCQTPLVGSTGVVICLWPGSSAAGTSRSLAVTGVVGSGTVTLQATTSSLLPDPVMQNNAANLVVVAGTPGTTASTMAIPALGVWGLSLLGLLLGVFGGAALRPRA